MATGWLISHDTIVTAGHCSYDWAHSLGRLTHVKAYVGYSGNDSIKDTHNYAVQFGTGKRVVTTEGWLTDGGLEPNDVSFILVDPPFDGIKPIKYQPTPMTGTDVVLGVVGYPGDYKDPKTNELVAVSFTLLLSRFNPNLTPDSSCIRCTSVRASISQRSRPRCFNMKLALMEVCDD